MVYVFDYLTLVNRDYNIYKEIIENPFVFSFFGVHDPREIKDIIEYSKIKDANIMKNIILGQNLNTLDLLVIYKILFDYKFFETEEFNYYSHYVDELIASSKVDEVVILIKEPIPEMEEMVVENIKRRFKNSTKIKLVIQDDIFSSKSLKKLSWNCVSFREVDGAIDLINSDVKLDGKDIILDESNWNKLDPVNYILLQEKGGRIDYRAMI